MGNLPFTAIGADGNTRQGIQVFAESLITTFTAEYTSAYAQEYTKHLLQDKDDEDTNKPVVGSYHLLQRDIHSLQKPKKTGMMTKRGAIVKNWKHRFFVVRSNYTVDYYENEESFKKNAKPKGTISPCGYEVVQDMENSILKRTRKLAETMGVDVNDIPAPDKFPDFTFELYHKRRRPWIMTAQNAEDMEDWCSIFEDCCYHCRGYKNEDPIARRAFPIAMRRTRFECGSGALSYSRGTEEQELSDFIASEIDMKMMGDVYSNIKGNWTIRCKMKEQVNKALDSAVMALVTPALKNLDTTVVMLRQNLDVLAAQKKDELAAVERKIMWEMNEQIKAPVDETLSKMKPDIECLIEMAIPPVESGFDKCREVFVDAVKELQKALKGMTEVNLKENADEVFNDFDHTYDRKSKHPNSCVDLMREKHQSQLQLQEMEISHLAFVFLGREFCKLLLDAEVYTFQELFMDSAMNVENMNKGEEAAIHSETIQEQVLQRFECDRLVALHDFLYKSLVEATNKVLRKELDPVCKPMIKPIQDVIPTALDTVVKVRDMYEKYVVEACQKFILKVLKEHDLEPPKAERGDSMKAEHKVKDSVQFDDPPRADSEVDKTMQNGDSLREDTEDDDSTKEDEKVEDKEEEQVHSEEKTDSQEITDDTVEQADESTRTHGDTAQGTEENLQDEHNGDTKM